MKKRILSVLLVMAMLLMPLIGCSDSAEPAATVSAQPSQSQSAAPSETQPAAEQPAETASQPSDQPADVIVDEGKRMSGGSGSETWPDPKLGSMQLPIVDEQIVVTFWEALNPNVISIIDDATEDTVVWKELAERTGIYIKFDAVHPDAATEKFNLICISGDYPDIFSQATSRYAGGGEAAIADGILIDHTPYITKEGTPQLYELMINQNMIEDVLTDSGDLPGLPAVSMQEETSASFGPMIRKDWLDKLGLEIPETLDELYNVLVAFRDELGADAALAICRAGVALDNGLVSAYGIPGLVLDAFGSTEPLYLDDDGKIQYGPAQPEFKEYLERINQWYEEGLIWSDFASFADTQNPDRELITSGRCGVFYAENIYISILKNLSSDPDFELVAIPNLTLEKGGTIPFKATGNVRASLVWSISTGSIYPEEITKFVNYMYTDEGALLCNYGIENQSFVYDEHGQPKLTDLILDNPNGLQSNVALFLYAMDRAPFYRDDLREQSGYSQAEKEAGDIWRSNYVEGRALDQYNLTTDETEAATLINSNIKTYVTEMILKYIHGTESLDTFDTYLATLESMDIQGFLDIHQFAYERYLSGEIVEVADPGPPPDGPPPG